MSLPLIETKLFLPSPRPGLVPRPRLRERLDRGLVAKLMLVSAWPEAGAHFDDRERAALAWAETVTLVADTGVPDEDYESAAEHFSEKELADLTIAIGLINVYNRVAVGFRREPESLARISG